MGRVETRLYKRRRKRARMVRWMIILVLLTCMVLLVWGKDDLSFMDDRIGAAGPTPVPSDAERTMATREVTLPQETWYAIQTGVFSTQEAARQKAAAYAERGAPGSVIQEGDKWRVFIACYGKEDDAAAVRTKLAQNQQVDTYLYAWSCPELRLRLTGLAGQIDATEAGFTLLSSTAAALRDTAVQLDAAQLTVEDTVTMIAGIERQISLWEETVHDRFGRAVPDLLEGMLKLTNGWDNRLGAVKSCKNATELSAVLKAQSMGMFDELGAWRRKLAAQ